MRLLFSLLFFSTSSIIFSTNCSLIILPVRVINWFSEVEKKLIFEKVNLAYGEKLFKRIKIEDNKVTELE